MPQEPRTVRYGGAMYDQAGIMCRGIFSGNITRHPMMAGPTYRIYSDGLDACDTTMNHGVMLPCHPTLSREDCDYIYVVISEFAESEVRG